MSTPCVTALRSDRSRKLAAVLLFTVIGALFAGAGSAGACSLEPANPTADFKVVTPTPTAEMPLTFDASTSEAGIYRIPRGPGICGEAVDIVTGVIREYRWDFDGNGIVDQSTTTPTTSHIFNASGPVRVGLVVLTSTPDGSAQMTSPVGVQDLSIAPAPPTTMTITDESTGAASPQRAKALRKRRARALHKRRAAAWKKRRARSSSNGRSACKAIAPTPVARLKVSRSSQMLTRREVKFIATGSKPGIWDVPQPGVPLQPDCTGRHPVSGTIRTYRWDLDGDGIYEQTTRTPSVTHTYFSPSEVEVRLIINSVAPAGASTPPRHVKSRPVTTTINIRQGLEYPM